MNGFDFDIIAFLSAGKDNAAVVIFLVLGAAIAIMTFIWDFALGKILGLCKRIKPIGETFFFRNFWLAVRVWFIFYIILRNVHPAPEFVYQAF